jgi:signal transduction histidine kinase
VNGGRSSLISRFALSTALLAGTIVVLAALFFHFYRGDFFQESFNAPLEHWASTIAERVAEQPDLASAVARNHNVGVIVSSSDGTVAFAPGGEAIDPGQLIAHDAGFRRINAEGNPGQTITFYLDHKQFARTPWKLLAGLLALLLITVGFVYYVQRSQLKPLSWLRDGVDAVSKGDFSTRVPVVRNDEIGQVGRAFNNMTGKVEQMINDHDRLMADVSHELRSPMARINVAVELLPESELRKEIKRDVREMEALTTVLLERERVRNRTEKLQAEPADLAALVKDVIKGFAGREPGIAEKDLPRELRANVDAALIKVLVQNLLDNALKFSLPDSRPVEISLARDDGDILFSVEDDGPGIPEKEAERVLEPFVKLDPSRGHRVGYGLGLNLCQRIVSAHGGSIRITPREGRGTRVQVSLSQEP